MIFWSWLFSMESAAQ